MGKLGEKSLSFTGEKSLVVESERIRRHKTDSELLLSRKLAQVLPERIPPKRPTKLLLNVTLERSLGAVQVVISPEVNVGDLVAAAVRQYVKEGRRPFLLTTDPTCFNLHYSQFSLESLDREEKLLELGSRNFFMCHNKDVAATTTKLLSSNQVDKATKIAAVPWLKFMDFLM
ncbi:hypothetical protein ACHQM5_020272 [Ranunculus cassubicifolius]